MVYLPSRNRRNHRSSAIGKTNQSLGENAGVKKHRHSQGFESQIVSQMERSLPAFRSFASGLCGDRFVADDLVQSACERALQRLDQVTNVDGVKSWVHRIIYTQWQDLLRKRKRRKAKMLSFGQSLAAIRQGELHHSERNSIAKLDVEKALDILTAENRAALILVAISGYNYLEASKVLEVPVGTVASRVARAKAQLADYLSSRRGLSAESPAYRRTYDESSG